MTTNSFDLTEVLSKSNLISDEQRLHAKQEQEETGDPIDEILLRYDSIITIEDGSKLGGFGSAVAEYIASKGVAVPVKIMGTPDIIIEHGTQRELHDEVGIGPDGIMEEVKKSLGVLVKE